jgi:hypothetical protein
MQGAEMTKKAAAMRPFLSATKKEVWQVIYRS